MFKITSMKIREQVMNFISIEGKDFETIYKEKKLKEKSDENQSTNVRNMQMQLALFLLMLKRQVSKT